MAEYERSRLIQYVPEEVFAFATDPQNLPNFLPTVHTVETTGEGRVKMMGEIRGRSYEDDGWLKLDPEKRRMEWGSDEANYLGWLTVSEDDSGTGARVVVHLSFAPFGDQSGRLITEEEVGDDPINVSLEAALDSLRNLIEGRGGKEEPDFVLPTA